MTLPILYVTDDLTRWGAGIARLLHAAEFDRNNYTFSQAIEGLQGAIVEVAGSRATSITTRPNSTALTFNYADGTSLDVPFTPILMHWKGEWAPAVDYDQLDFVTVEFVGLFAVLIAHTSAATFDAAATDPDSGDPLYKKLIGYSGVTAALADLTDVALSGLADKNFLLYDLPSTDWKNVTPTTATAALDAMVGDTGSGGTKGLVPAPASGDAAAGKFLKADGTWAVAPGGSGSASLAGDTDVLIASPANNDVLQYKSSDGLWHNEPLSSLAGTVTSVATGTGLSGGPVTTTGTISLATIADGALLANTSGATAAPIPTALSDLLDHVFGNARGDVLFRGASAWVVLPPGSAGQYLKSQGASADLAWDSPAGSGTVTSVATGTGLSGGTITATGTISLATITDGDVLANISGSTAAPIPTTMTALIDHVLGSVQGDVLYRSASSWGALAPGKQGFFLQTQGSGANPQWASVKGNQSGGGTTTTSWLTAAHYATIAALASNTYANGASGVGATLTATANGALSVDGSSPSAGNRILVKNEGTTSHNGVYSVTQAGDGSHAYILTRVTDFDQSAEIVQGTAIIVSGGTANANSAWVMIDGGTITVGTSPIDFEALTATFPTCAAGQILGNPNTFSAPPIPSSLSSILDEAMGAARGDVLYRGNSGWAALAPGTSGQFLKTNGASADPSWGTASGSGTVTDIAAGTGISTGGSDITITGTISLAAIADGDVLANTSGGSAAPIPTTVSALLDAVFSSTQGKILRRGASAWGAEDAPLPVATFMPGVPANDAIARIVMTEAGSFPANFSGSYGPAKTASTGTATVTVNKNGSAIGTVTYTASATPSLATSGGTAKTFAAGDIIEFAFPSSADATLADIAITLRAIRS